MTEAAQALSAFELETPRGPRLCLHHGARSRRPRGGIVYVHPFAEEMNKSRRMAAVASRAFAAAGFEVLQIDLAGCGDSPGDFGDATWSDWLHDVRDACAWLQRRVGSPPLLWGLRAGCLLAFDAARLMTPADAPRGFLLWQPPASGRQLAQQFLRLRLAADALLLESTAAEGACAAEGGESTSTRDKPADDTAAAEQEIAGYRVHPQMLAGLQQSRLLAPTADARFAVLEATTREPAQLLPATQRLVDEWRAAGHDVRAGGCPGPGFWQTQEIEEASALVAASLEALAWLEAPAPEQAT